MSCNVVNYTGDTSHYARVAQVVLQNNEAVRVLRGFSVARISAIVLKGAALRGRVYASPEQRVASDVDVLVQRADWERADALLLSLGYVIFPDDYAWTAVFTHEFMGETPYRKGAMVVDLHWHPVAISWFRPATAFDLDGLWSRAVPTEIAGAPALRLCPEDELIHLCYHTAIHHGLTHAHAYRDIIGVVRVEQENLDWTTLTIRAREWRVSVAVWAALSVVRMLKPEAIPAEVLGGLNVPKWRQMLLRPLLRRARAGKPVLISGTMRFLGVLLIDRMRDLPGVVLRGLFPGKRWLQLRYDLTPRQAFWRQFTYPLEVVGRGVQAVVGSLIKAA